MPEREKGPRILSAVGHGPARAEPCPDVQEAARRVATAWQNDRGDALNATEAADAIEWLATAVRQVRDGGSVPTGGPAATVLGRHLLALLRAELIGGWGKIGRASCRERV